MTPFDQGYAADYDDRIQQRVPGYRLMHELVPPLLGAILGETASILVVGAGTGTELNTLARQGSRWSLTAIDASGAMLEVARERMRLSGYCDRVSFHVADVTQFRGVQPYDAVVAVLVAHFLPDDGHKSGFFSALAANLRPGAPLVLVDLGGTAPPLPQAHREWALANGMDKGDVALMTARFSSVFFPVDKARLTELLATAGCGVPLPFFQALSFVGYLAIKRDR